MGGGGNRDEMRNISKNMQLGQRPTDRLAYLFILSLPSCSQSAVKEIKGNILEINNVCCLH